MAKKRKSRKPSFSSKQQKPALSLEAQEQRIRALFTAKKYKEASECCKKLLKQENRPEWLELLADVYCERSKELAAKGMPKEALIIWRKRSELCGKPLADPFYFRTLHAAGMDEQILAFYQNNAAVLEQTECLRDVRERLAALSLGQSGELLKKLPEDDVLNKDHPVALAALEAYCAGDDDLLHDLLSKISFRSPFRDFRRILKALSLPENDASAAKLLGQIAPTSSFATFAEAIVLSNEPDVSLFSTISTLKPEITEFVISRKGFNSELLKFFEEWRKLGSSPSVEALIRFISRHQQAIGKQLSRELALKLLAHSSKTSAVFLKAFGKLTPLETAHTEAQRVELRKTHPRDVVREWEKVDSSLRPEDCESPLIHQLSLAVLAQRKLQYVDQIDHNGNLNDYINATLEWILQHDPKDHARYLRLIANYREQDKLKEARKLLETAMSNFPGDIAILTEAAETALAGNAYKKAAEFAKRILKKDPINTQVRTALIDAHLSHTRKLMDNRKYSLAEKELDIAASWSKTPVDKARVDLVRGTLRLDQKQLLETIAIWKTATATLGSGLCGHFYLLLELLQQQRSVGAVLKKTEIKLVTKSVTEKHLLQFFQLLNNYKKSKQSKNVEQVLKQLQPVLNSLASLKYSAADFGMICEILTDFNHPSLSLRYAEEACKQWPDELVFVYYAIAATTAIDGYISGDDLDELDDLIEDAGNKGQNKLKERAIHLINSSKIQRSAFDFAPDFDFDTSAAPTMDSLMDMLLGVMPSYAIEEMKKEMGEKEFMERMRAMIVEGGLLDGDDDECFNPFEVVPKKRIPKR